MKREKVGSIVFDLFEEKLDIEEISTESKIVEDLGADSLDVVELLMEIEDEFNIEIPDVDAEKLLTVGKVIDYIVEHTS